VPEGNGGDERIGRKMVVKSISLRFRITANDTILTGTTNLSEKCIVMLVQDTQCNGTAANWGDLMVGGLVGHTNLENRERFRILKRWDWVWRGEVIFDATDVVGFGYEADIDYYKKCNIDVVTDNATPTFQNLRSNNIFLIAVASEAARFQLTGRTRIRFVD